MKGLQIVLDVIALIIFVGDATKGEMVSPWFVVVWIIIAMIDHIHREEEV